MDRWLDPAPASAPANDPGREPRRPAYEEIENLDPAAGLEAVREILDESNPALVEFFREVRAYRGRVFSEVETAASLRIEDQAVEDRIGDLPVSFLGDRGRGTLPRPEGKVEPARLVRLSSETAIEQSIDHEDLAVDDYRLLPEWIESGEMFEDEDPNRILFFRRFNGRRHKAVVEQTSNNELFLTSFHRPRRRQLPEALRTLE